MMQNLNKINSHLLIILIYSILFFGCNKKEENQNVDPTCNIINPLNNEEFIQGEKIEIKAVADDIDGEIKYVKFEINEDSVFVANSIPYTIEWDSEMKELGAYTIKATAFDKNNGTYTDEITILIVKIDSLGRHSAKVNDYDNNIYRTIKIGNQWWMAENLKTTHYSNGTSIPLVENINDWDNLENGDKAMCYYDNSIPNSITYGALYTFGAAMNGLNSSETNPIGVQGICPTGWHLPSDNEWKQLEMYLGMSQADADYAGYRGSIEASKLAGNSELWEDGDLKNSLHFGTSGFNALPGGRRHGDGIFAGSGSAANFLSSTKYDTQYVWYRYISSYEITILRDFGDETSGLSIRCVKDN